MLCRLKGNSFVTALGHVNSITTRIAFFACGPGMLHFAYFVPPGLSLIIATDAQGITTVISMDG